MSDVLGFLPTSDWSARAKATQFVCQVEGAAAFLKAAHADDRVRIEPPKPAARRVEPPRHGGWYSIVLHAAATQLRQIIVVFDKHPAQGRGAAAELEAFRMLSELTTAGPQLLALVRQNRSLAVRELARHLEFVREQFEATAALEDTLAIRTDNDGAGAPAADADDLSFGRIRDALVDRAGGTLSLTEATELLGVSRQALHKRIVAGTALGMMVANEIAVPRLQIAERDGRHAILPGIGVVTKLFKRADAGPWMALQFLVDLDPNLGRAPIEVLREGDEQSVVRAARAHLHLDEE
jgi:hypothetical protein